MRGRMAREGIVDSLNLLSLGCFRGTSPQRQKTFPAARELKVITLISPSLLAAFPMSVKYSIITTITSCI